MTPCALSFAAPDERPRSIVLAGTRYATESLMRCSRCGRLVVGYRDPDVRGAGARSAHGLDLYRHVTDALDVPSDDDDGAAGGSA